MKRLWLILGALALLLAAACGGKGAAPTENLPATGGTPGPAVTAAGPGLPAATGQAGPSTPNTLPAATSPAELDAFSSRLGQALQARDFTALRALMPARFSIATWNTQLMEYTSEEALDLLRQGELAEGSAPRVDFSADLPALLGGTDPLGLWGPVANVVRAALVTGLGPQADRQGAVVIGRDAATGQFYWHGLLVAQSGSFEAGGAAPTGAAAGTPAGDVLPTEVKSVTALDTLNLRSGPGLDFAVEGLLQSGETITVTGKSPDSGWWRVTCSQDASGNCWVSADPALTKPGP